jgi:hypothetical protein
LPCLYFDSPNIQERTEFKVLPVCCTTYHYSVKVSYNTIEPLTLQNLRSCTDERTHDFTLALMDFAEWDIKRKWDPNAGEMDSDDENEFYLWPNFILDLINAPRDWAAWRKRVERNSGGSRTVRKNLYFAALCDGFREEVEKANAEAQTESSQEPDAGETETESDDPIVKAATKKRPRTEYGLEVETSEEGDDALFVDTKKW